MCVFKFLLIFYGLYSVLGQNSTNNNGHKSIKIVQPNEENTTERKDHNTCTRLENELTRTNQLLNSLYTEFAASKELFRKDTVLTKQSLAALTIQHIETEKRIGALTDDHSATKQALKRTQTELDHTTEELANVKRELEHEKERHRQSRIIPPTETTVVTSQSAVSGIAFFATMNAHPENLGIHQIVDFPKTITNEGNAWDSLTSTFKAPRAGLYYFSASIMSHQGEDIETELVCNGVGLIYSYDGDKGTLGVGSLSGVLKLNPGDDVWIRIYNNPNVNAGNVRVYGYGWSWFSGFIISQ